MTIYVELILDMACVDVLLHGMRASLRDRAAQIERKIKGMQTHSAWEAVCQ